MPRLSLSPSILLTGLFALALMFCQSATAADFKPEEIPPQHAIGLYKAKGVRDTYYLLTKDKEYEHAQGGNHYLLVYEDGKLRFPRQTSGMVYFDGGSADLQFENGERLILPTERVSVGYLGVQINPIIMSADRAPLNLQKVEITDALLKRLKFSSFISPKIEKPAKEQTVYKDPYITFVSPESVQMIEFNPFVKMDYKEEDEVAKIINEIDPRRIKTADVNQGSFYGYGNNLLIVITDPEVSLPQLQAKIGTRGRIKGISDITLNEFAKNFEHIRTSFPKADEEIKLVHIKFIVESMGQLERYFLLLKKWAQYETAIQLHANGVKNPSVGTAKNTIAHRKHPFYTQLMAKIRQTARMGYETLHEVNHPAAQEILTHTFEEFDYAAVDIVNGKSKSGQEFYFDLWLKFMLTDFNFVDQFSKDDVQKNIEKVKRLGRSSGGVFDNFKVSGTLLILKSEGLVPHFMEKRPSFILNLLGLPGQKDHLKRSLIQFIIDADKKAARLVAWSDRAEAASEQNRFGPADFDAKGVKNITYLLDHLAWTTYWAKSMKGFSIAEYQMTVLEIFTTLFDIAPVSLKTTGTMASLINATNHILKDVQNANTILGAPAPPAVQQAANVLENRLRMHFQKSITHLGYSRTEVAIEACNILLTPDNKPLASSKTKKTYH